MRKLIKLNKNDRREALTIQKLYSYILNNPKYSNKAILVKCCKAYDEWLIDEKFLEEKINTIDYFSELVVPVIIGRRKFYTQDFIARDFSNLIKVKRVCDGIIKRMSKKEYKKFIKSGEQILLSSPNLISFTYSINNKYVKQFYNLMDRIGADIFEYNKSYYPETRLTCNIK